MLICTPLSSGVLHVGTLGNCILLVLHSASKRDLYFLYIAPDLPSQLVTPWQQGQLPNLLLKASDFNHPQPGLPLTSFFPMAKGSTRAGLGQYQIISAALQMKSAGYLHEKCRQKGLLLYKIILHLSFSLELTLLCYGAFPWFSDTTFLRTVLYMFILLPRR